MFYILERNVNFLKHIENLKQKLPCGKSNGSLFVLDFCDIVFVILRQSK